MTTRQATPEVRQTDDEKWRAWVQRGAAHDRQVHRRLRIAAALLAGALGVAAFARVLLV